MSYPANTKKKDKIIFSFAWDSSGTSKLIRLFINAMHESKRIVKPGVKKYNKK